MADKKTAVINGSKLPDPTVPVPDELERARDIARRYRCEFIDLSDFQLHHDLFEKIPVHLMFRYNFVPLDETADGRLAIAIADPSQLMMIDEISLLLASASSPRYRPSNKFPTFSRRPSSPSACWKTGARDSRST